MLQDYSFLLAFPIMVNMTTTDFQPEELSAWTRELNLGYLYGIFLLAPSLEVRQSI